MDKTAVIIIHGIGEQRPMQTVRSFARFFAGSFLRSKPDRDATLFELRRLSTLASDEGTAFKDARSQVPGYPADTVFYEFYWAYHYRDTRLGWVIEWFGRTFWDLCKTGQLLALRARLKFMLLTYAAAVIGLLGALGLLVWGMHDLFGTGSDGIAGVMKLFGGTVIPGVIWLARPIMLGWVGDAARYFGRSPDNPIERQQIRQIGVGLLERLHEQQNTAGTGPEYQRIVLVGHSLGSVVAYDVLTQYWAKVHRTLEIKRDSGCLGDIESNLDLSTSPTAPAGSWQIRGLDDRKVDAFRTAQTALFKEINAPAPSAWRVSDLVTLGSPLTYARVLLASTPAELVERQQQRELPTCPPSIDKYPDKDGNRRCFFAFPGITGPDEVVPDHTATFAVTRWTNIFFNNDPIGGPIAPLFGWGVRDVNARCGIAPGPHTGSWLKRRWNQLALWLLSQLGGAHTRYWDVDLNDPTRPFSPECAEYIRGIVNGSL